MVDQTEGEREKQGGCCRYRGLKEGDTLQVLPQWKLQKCETSCDVIGM